MTYRWKVVQVKGFFGFGREVLHIGLVTAPNDAQAKSKALDAVRKRMGGRWTQWESFAVGKFTCYKDRNLGRVRVHLEQL